MAIATIDRAPPPLFRQGPSALTKLILCSALAVFLMVADHRFVIARQLRSVIITVLHYPQQALGVPVEAFRDANRYWAGLDRALGGEQAAHRALALQSERSMRVERLEAENTQLRALLDLRPAFTARTQTAEVLYETTDPYSRKVVIDRGAINGIVAGSPVINEAGVLGQVTRVYPLASEVTLLTDKDAAIPVLNTRTQARSAAFGSVQAAGALEMRFMAGNADVRPGDALTTSGVDGVYPPGMPVATVTTVDRKSDAGFARILLTPAAKNDGVRFLLVLEPLAQQLPSRPDVAASAAEPAVGKASGPRRGAKASRAAAAAAPVNGTAPE